MKAGGGVARLYTWFAHVVVYFAEEKKTETNE